MKIEWGLARPDAWGGADFYPKSVIETPNVVGSMLFGIIPNDLRCVYSKGVELLALRGPFWAADDWDRLG